MKLVTLDRPPAGRAGVVIGNDVLDMGLASDVFPLARWIPASLAEIIAVGDEGMSLVRSLVDKVERASPSARAALQEKGALVPWEEARFLAPIPRPGILLSHGRAYKSHWVEMGNDLAKLPEHPVGFLKNSNAIIGHGQSIVLPEAAPDMVDVEAEIAVVFSRLCHNVTKEEAMDYVLGMTIVNDVSARDWVPSFKAGPDLNRMSKQFATFAPMGPAIVTLDEIPDPQNMHIITKINDFVMQDAWTSDLIWSLPELIAFYSKWYPFQPGDVMTTGTPSGVGYARDPKIFVKPGDSVSMTIEGVCELINPVTRRGGSSGDGQRRTPSGYKNRN